MDERFRAIVSSFLGWSFLIFAGTICYSYFWAFSQMGEVVLAYILSFIFIASNFFAIRNFQNKTHEIFYRRFLIILALRFAFVLLALVFILKVIKFHQIYFTVSFIISYILHSVIEIILISKILQTDN